MNHQIRPKLVLPGQQATPEPTTSKLRGYPEPVPPIRRSVRAEAVGDYAPVYVRALAVHMVDAVGKCQRSTFPSPATPWLGIGIFAAAVVFAGYFWSVFLHLT